MSIRRRLLSILFTTLGDDPAPLVPAFVLGPMLGNNLREPLILPRGDLWTFVQRPISAAPLPAGRGAADRARAAVLAQEARAGGAG